jgi:predicted ATPase
VIEDVHWIDAASESMLADFLDRRPAGFGDGPDHRAA